MDDLRDSFVKYYIASGRKNLVWVEGSWNGCGKRNVPFVNVKVIVGTE